MAKSKKVPKTEVEKINKIKNLLNSYSIPLKSEEVNKNNYHVIKFIKNNSLKFDLRIHICPNMKINNILADLIWDKIKDYDKNLYELEQNLVSEIQQKYADEIQERINRLQKSKDEHNKNFTTDLQNKITEGMDFVPEGIPLQSISII
jgi:hypothetical protein